MDITSYVLQGRDNALVYGDYSTYHTQLSKRLLSSRKKLGTVTRNRGKFHKPEAVTSENIANNKDERAWAQAMSMKAAHATGRKGIAGRTKSHIVSRLNRAANTARNLVGALSETAVSGASTRDILDAKAYEALIVGAMHFEKRSWLPCLQSYAVSRVIYTALTTTGKGDIYKDLLADTIDPSIRYAAYQLKTPRTIPIPTIAHKAFPDSDAVLVQQINEVDPGALSGESDANTCLGNPDKAPDTITWRSREVRIEDAQIALAWASVNAAKQSLAENLAKGKSRSPREAAASYDDILTATQNAVDATKQAIDELRGEGVAQGDARMQSLQITRTAVNFEMISWRIGRNRVLTGESDGAVEEHGRSKAIKTTETDGKGGEASGPTELPISRKLTKLKEKAALYDGTLQNLESIKELPGVAADQTLLDKLSAFVSYFFALKALSIARSHAIIGNVANALALIQHAFERCELATKLLPDAPAGAPGAPPNIEVSSDDVKRLLNLVQGELRRHQAIVHVDNLRKEELAKSTAAPAPLVERLHQYPAGGVDLSNVVEFPPKKALIPVKPIFLDVAWNYISYPGKTPVAAKTTPAAAAEETAKAGEPAQQQKRGWFGFGR
ncbi:signal recognition particle, putative [Cordyceps militaris CM01]|uniref:Signal recognition particle subunit SRP68 n=1 Tax=Cordyceps militaris (strain CM01) TaxID=983644 RepID=G3JJ19_CORMM|nr:signal recognition particle, putative [Cordyceps militaris CM01]EGX91166.1 signal recognition particle, putative [Cordyceps militaris CM01]